MCFCCHSERRKYQSEFGDAEPPQPDSIQLAKINISDCTVGITAYTTLTHVDTQSIYVFPLKNVQNVYIHTQNRCLLSAWSSGSYTV